ncbi:tRNA (adenosine(37)-N6)-threonylcarbamoyltransferase complex ATPase subunit type 1 TsaE [Paenibacillus sp. FSL L8-0641]|uniref:tRNA (adenosine(37)-N6)-threonylcarbamoyltransferase complex ATPase subunit type 1 TsaE n=1 Tax=Paenibacillus sp. FSL L8-0641 TaxID=2921605 RepID=UPI0030F50749
MTISQEQFTFRSASEAQTGALACFLAAKAVPGTVIVLDGDLGAGKTAFSKAFASHLGVPGIVNSPTFTLIKEYEGRLPLYHMDVYRISQDEAEDLGLDEYFYGTGVCLVEWGSIIPDILPEQRLHMYIETTDVGERLIHLTGYGEPYEQWCRSLRENGV